MTEPLPAAPTPDAPVAPYSPRRIAHSHWIDARGLRMHLHAWGDPAAVTDDAPLRVMVHGWMDMGASFQFVVDALDDDRPVVAPDWRGFGLTEARTDAYWFPDYLGDLDAMLDVLSPGRPVDLIGHSMGGNVAMAYAGVRPARIRRLVNLEGFGLPDNRPDEAPARLARWLDELKTPQTLKPYASVTAVADRLRANNPRLSPDKAAWLAAQWSAQKTDGRWHLRADGAHKRVNPALYRVEEVLAIWRRITAPTLWIEGEQTRPPPSWVSRYTREDFDARLAVVPQLQRCVLQGAAHMLHHDQPEALAERLGSFLRG
jgi:pimeloyl-ACP methyl ester carboxylesterase